MKTIIRTSLWIACATVAISAQASLVNLSTGADVNSDGSDKNWKLVPPPLPADYTAGASGPAYVVVDDGAFPFNGYWSRNGSDPNSKWITYSNPFQTGGDAGHTFDYQLTFSTTGGDLPINWLSDNSSKLYLDGTFMGARGSEQEYRDWLTNPVILDVKGGTHVIDVLVDNWPQSSGNPSGLRVNFFAPVPEPGTILAGGLLALPFGISVLRRIRRNN